MGGKRADVHSEGKYCNQNSAVFDFTQGTLKGVILTRIYIEREKSIGILSHISSL